MATSTKQPTKKGKLKQMPSQNGSVAVEDPPPTPQTPFDSEPAAPTPPKPPSDFEPKPTGRPRGPSHREFFEIVRSVNAADWGTRIYLYLYQFEPVCNEKINGEKKYLCRFDQPVADEQVIMLDYGSGKYRLVLANNKPLKEEKGQAIETYDFEIFNPKYPPKIPKTVWKNDPRNKRWEALLPPEGAPPPPQPAPSGLAEFTEAFKVVSDLRRDIRDELQPETPAAPPPATDSPFDTVQKIMNMRANDPMVTLLLERMNAQDRAMEASRTREHELQQKLIDARTIAPAAPPKGLLEQILELAPAQDKFDLVKRLFGGNHSNGTGPLAEGEKIVRAAKMGTLEFLSEVLPKVFESPIANALATKMMQQPAQQAPMNGTARPQVQQPPAVDPFQKFIADIATPAMLEYMADDAPGKALADWMFCVWPQYTLRLQKFSHPAFPGLVGAPAIIEGYRHTPDVWPRLAAKEAQFTQFVQEFCAWKPPADEEPIEAATPVTDEDGWSQPEREETAQ